MSEKKRVGLPCPRCGSMDSGVLDSRGGHRRGFFIRRRRECSNGHRYTTYEQLAVEDSVEPEPMSSAENETAGVAVSVVTELEEEE